MTLWWMFSNSGSAVCLQVWSVFATKLDKHSYLDLPATLLVIYSPATCSSDHCIPYLAEFASHKKPQDFFYTSQIFRITK